MVGRHPQSGLAIPTQVDQQANKATTDRIDHGSKLTNGHNGDHRRTRTAIMFHKALSHPTVSPAKRSRLSTCYGGHSPSA